MNRNIFYFELSSKPNYDIDGIIVYMWKNIILKQLSSNEVMNIQDVTGMGFGYKERA